MTPVKINPVTKETAGAATPTASNSESTPIDQDGAVGAIPPVEETAPSGNVPVPPHEVPAEPHCGSDAAAPAAPPLQPVNGRLPLAQLRAHEINEKIYGARDSIKDLVESIGVLGIIDPIVITKDGRIVSGHRRYRAAEALKHTDVPVRVFESDDELEIKRALLVHNRHRVKNNTQLAEEAKLMMEIEKALAARRKAAAGKGEVAKLPPQQKGKARDIVGANLGISGKSVDAAVEVIDAAHKLQASGDEAGAAELKSALNKGMSTGRKLAETKGLLSAKPKPDGNAKAKKTGSKITLVQEEKPGVNTNKPSELSAKAPAPSETLPDDTDSDKALEAADSVLTFLRSDAAGTLSLYQERNWKRIFEQIDDAREDIGL